MAARPPPVPALWAARASAAPRHGRRKLGRGSPGFAAPTTVAKAAVRAATSQGDSKGGGCDPAAAILTTNRRRVLRDGNQEERAGRGCEAGGVANSGKLSRSRLWSAE
ncbi:hypothetical protein HispidOSU_020767, partial [Sigmodon hispidus]